MRLTVCLVRRVSAQPVPLKKILGFQGSASIWRQLYQNFFRGYDPTFGRYIQSDLIGLRGGINTFGYAAQNSLIYVDPASKYGGAVLVRTVGSILGITTMVGKNLDQGGGQCCQ